MWCRKAIVTTVVFQIIFVGICFGQKTRCVISCDKNNDLYKVLVSNMIKCERYDSPLEALNKVQAGGSLFILSQGYPLKQTKLDDGFYKQLEEKKM